MTTNTDTTETASDAAPVIDTTNDFGPVNGQPDGFNAKWYLFLNLDVAASGMDPLSHYQNYGKNEGRQPYENGPGKPASPKKMMLASANALADDTGNAMMISANASGQVSVKGTGAGMPAVLQMLGIVTKWVGQQLASKG